MRRVLHSVGMLVISCSLLGCGAGGGEATATPDNLEVAQAAAKKMQLMESELVAQRKAASAASTGKGLAGRGGSRAKN